MEGFGLCTNLMEKRNDIFSRNSFSFFYIYSSVSVCAEVVLITIGEYLKKKRKDVGLSQAFVASELGYSNGQFISNIERDLALPPLNTITWYADCLCMKDKEKNKLKRMFIKEYKRQVEEAFK